MMSEELVHVEVDVVSKDDSEDSGVCEVREVCEVRGGEGVGGVRGEGGVRGGEGVVGTIH